MTAVPSLSICPVCEKPILAGERRVSWFAADEVGNVDKDDRGSVHLSHLHDAERIAQAAEDTAKGTREAVRLMSLRGPLDATVEGACHLIAVAFDRFARQVRS